YGDDLYGFQAHMEFTHDIIAAGLRDIGGKIKAKGPFVQTEEQLLAYDYTEMNGLLSSFLDALSGKYGG
nr:glutamine amidotransferase [Clostridia bacterium]